jgi:uncharacterized protein
LDGKSFFYTNAMQIKNNFTHPDLEVTRSGWFTCSCCPTNIIRLIPSVPGYIYAWAADSLYVNLYISSSIKFQSNRQIIHLAQQSDYPWNGNIRFKVNVNSAKHMTILFRIPGWARNEAMPGNLYQFQNVDSPQFLIKINGFGVHFSIEKGYIAIGRLWKDNDEVELDLPMEVKKVSALSNLKIDSGKIAIQRGPLIYCAEWADNNGRTSNLIIPGSTIFTSTYQSKLLNGVTTLEANVPSVELDKTGLEVFTQQHRLVAIPYYAWANRGGGEMNIWFPSRLKDIDLISKNK